MAGQINYLNPTPPASQPRAKPKISSVYTVQLDVRRDGESIITMDTPLPENFDMGLGSSYDRPFAQPLSAAAGEATGAGGAAQSAETVLRATTGQTSVVKYLSGAVWSSGSVMQLKIPFQIHAYENARTEVSDKMKKLLQLVTPSTSAVGTLVAPGPHVGNAGSLLAGDFSGGLQLGGDDITLTVGRFLIFNPCIITDVAVTFDSQFDASGQPIAAMINVSFEAFFTTTTEDLDKMFAVL